MLLFQVVWKSLLSVVGCIFEVEVEIFGLDLVEIFGLMSNQIIQRVCKLIRVSYIMVFSSLKGFVTKIVGR